MSRTSDEPDETTEEYLLRTMKAKWEALAPADAIVFTLGAYLGFHGYTPLTALINVAKGVQAALSGPLTPEIAVLEALSPIFFFARLLTPQLPPETPVSERVDRVLKTTLGAIEAYALTRPGAIQGIAATVDALVPL